MSAGMETETAAAIRRHYQKRERIIVRGHGSKDFYGNLNNDSAQVISTTALDGVIEYEPGELFIGVWAGTAITAICDLLRENRQMLAFDPPAFGGRGTMGGAVAAGLAGPGRFCYGGVRDAILGISLINGCGELLRFGGRVIKNVAGYDISRLNAGAMGTLGLITKIYLRTAPLPTQQTTRALQMTAQNAATYTTKLTRQVALSASFYDGETLYLRQPESATKQTGGEQADNTIWQTIRDQTHPFFANRENAAPLWRIVMPPTKTRPPKNGKEASEWRGELLWSQDNEQTPAQIRTNARKDGGNATLFHKGNLQTDPAFDTPPPALFNLQKEIKKAFDPHGIFNPGRLHPDY